MPRTKSRLLPVLFYILLIFAVSSIPSLKAPGPSFAAKDKIAHTVEYTVLGALLFWGVGWTVSRQRGATFGFLLAVGASIAALDEFYQSFIPGRMMSVVDWSADVLGVAIGCGVFVFTRWGRLPRPAEKDAAIRESEGKLA